MSGGDWIENWKYQAVLDQNQEMQERIQALEAAIVRHEHCRRNTTGISDSELVRQFLESYKATDSGEGK